MGRRSGLGRTVRAGLAVSGRISKSIRNRSGGSRTAAGPFSTQPPWAAASWLFFRPAAAGLAQIWALRYRQSGSDRLEKQPTDPAPAGRRHYYIRDGALDP